MTSTRDEFDPKKYQPVLRGDAEKLRLLGATREELRKWFGVHEFSWISGPDEHKDFARALQVEPITTLRIIRGLWADQLAQGLQAWELGRMSKNEAQSQEASGSSI